MLNNSESENTVDEPGAQHQGEAGSAPQQTRRKRRVIVGTAAAAAVLVAGGVAGWAGGLFGPTAATQVPSAFTKYDIQASGDGSHFVSSTREEPLMLSSAGTAKDLIGTGLEWKVTIRNEGTATHSLYFVLCDPTSSKVKYRVSPGKDYIYPDLFTQLKFTVTDSAGNKIIDNVILGADENHDPNGDGTVRGDITKVLAANGGVETFTVKAVFDYDPADKTRTKLAAYSGVSTDFGVRIEGESF